MAELLERFFDSVIKFLSNDNCVSILVAIISSIVSYRLAKYSATKPNKLKVKQAQLLKVYLPLYRIFSEISDKVDKDKVIDIYNKASEILDKNYELAFPQLHALSKTLEADIDSDRDFTATIRIMKHQIDIDYELLKKKLGYPSENFFSIYARMTFKQKATFYISWFNVIWLFIPVALFPLYCYKVNEIIASILMFLSIIIMLIVLLRLNKWLKNLKD